jgi:hypothetical protein
MALRNDEAKPYEPIDLLTLAVKTEQPPCTEPITFNHSISPSAPDIETPHK